MFTKANPHSSDDGLIPLRRDAEARPRAPSTATPPGTRREQLRRQRARIQEYLETIELLTQERDTAREQLVHVSDLADRMLSAAEEAQHRALRLETQLAQVSAENDALLEQGMFQAEQLDLLQTRLRLFLAD